MPAPVFLFIVWVLPILYVKSFWAHRLLGGQATEVQTQTW